MITNTHGTANIIKFSKFAALLIASTLMLSACSSTTANSTNQTKVDDTAQKVVVSTGSIANRIVATGKVIANASASVAFQRGGVVSKVLIKEGQQVKAGQPLATLDVTDLELTAQQQWASYLSAQATYSQTIKGPTTAEMKSAQAAIARGVVGSAHAAVGASRHGSHQ